MNNLYFACTDCKIYTDAGYRWAYWTLEHKGIVQKGKPVSVNAVLNADEYWNPSMDDSSRWLYRDVFPAVKSLLQEHEDHNINFGDGDVFLFTNEEDTYFEWLQVGYLAELSPRTLAEQLCFTNWEEAEEYISKQEIPPWWWSHTDEFRQKARAKFEEIVCEKHAS